MNKVLLSSKNMNWCTPQALPDHCGSVQAPETDAGSDRWAAATSRNGAGSIFDADRRAHRTGDLQFWAGGISDQIQKNIPPHRSLQRGIRVRKRNRKRFSYQLPRIRENHPVTGSGNGKRKTSQKRTAARSGLLPGMGRRTEDANQSAENKAIHRSTIQIQPCAGNQKGCAADQREF